MLRLLAFTLLTAGAIQSQSVAGEWDGQFNTPGGLRNIHLVLQLNGDKLTGSVQRVNDTLPLTGSIKGDTVRFSYNIVYNDNPMELVVTAKVTGDAMDGTISFGGMAEDVFTAKRKRNPH
jgi:hypothetical protein